MASVYPGSEAPAWASAPQLVLVPKLRLGNLPAPRQWFRYYSRAPLGGSIERALPSWSLRTRRCGRRYERPKWRREPLPRLTFSHRASYSYDRVLGGWLGVELGPWGCPMHPPGVAVILSQRARVCSMSVQSCGRFLCESLFHPSQVGRLARSSRSLARRMVRWINWERVGSVVEYGPGTGVVTEQILRSKQQDTPFFAVELNPNFVATLMHRFPGLPVWQDSVANIEAICRQQGVPARRGH